MLCVRRIAGRGMADFDLAVIGGGLNGAGIARDAAGRGIRVLLVEQGDLAAAAPAAPAALLRGGLALAPGGLRALREALIERERLLALAPQVVRPQRFVLPHHHALRWAWRLRLGLLACHRLHPRGRFSGPSPLNLTLGPLGVPLKRQFKLGFRYTDAVLDEERLVLLTARDAADRGAEIRPRARLARADRADGIWRLALNARGRREIITARVLVNASGAWSERFAHTVLRLPPPGPVRLTKGSHVLVQRLFDHDHAYVFETPDRRVLHAIPWGDGTLIGAVMSPFDGDPGAAAPGRDEIIYLCRAASLYFRETVRPEQVLRPFAGVKAEPDGGRAGPLIALDRPLGEAPLLTVLGGCAMTYRLRAEAAVNRIARFFAAAPAWTATVPLPGSDRDAKSADNCPDPVYAATTPAMI
jgi:glycerol-3-phosphate dehydrogenase